MRSLFNQKAELLQRRHQPFGMAGPRSLEGPEPDAYVQALQDRFGNRGLLRALGAGQPLPSPLRRKFEQSLKVDLSAVRLHTDGAAAGRARDLDALAFSVGSDIYLDRDACNPTSTDGEHLLAHEVAHVAQAACHGSASSTTNWLSKATDPAEREANAAARAMVQGRPARVTERPHLIARQPKDPGASPQPDPRFTYAGHVMPPIPFGQLQYDSGLGQFYFDTPSGRWYLGSIGRTLPWFVSNKPEEKKADEPTSGYDPLLRQFYTENPDGSRDYWGPIGAANTKPWHRPKLDLEQPIGLFGNWTNPARIIPPGYRMWEGNFQPNLANTGDYGVPFQLSYRQTFPFLGTHWEVGGVGSLSPGSSTSGSVGGTLRVGPVGKDEGVGGMLQPSVGILTLPSGKPGANPAGLGALETTLVFKNGKLQWDTDVIGSVSQYYKAGDRWANPFITAGGQSQLTLKLDDTNNLALEALGLAYRGHDLAKDQWFWGSRWGLAAGYIRNWMDLSGRDPATPEGYDTNSVSVYLSYTQDKFPGTNVIHTVTINASLGLLRRILNLP